MFQKKLKNTKEFKGVISEQKQIPRYKYHDNEEDKQITIFTDITSKTNDVKLVSRH